MKVPTRFIPSLTEQDKQSLQTIWKESDSHRQRTRAQAILLSDQGFAIDQIAQICDVQRDTVAGWFDAFEQEYLQGLVDAPRPGAPRRFTPQEEARILDLLDETPHQVRTVKAQIQKETGKVLTDDILSRITQEHGYT